MAEDTRQRAWDSILQRVIEADNIVAVKKMSKCPVSNIVFIGYLWDCLFKTVQVSDERMSKIKHRLEQADWRKMTIRMFARIVGALGSTAFVTRTVWLLLFQATKWLAEQVRTNPNVWYSQHVFNVPEEVRVSINSAAEAVLKHPPRKIRVHHEIAWIITSDGAPEGVGFVLITPTDRILFSAPLSTTGSSSKVELVALLLAFKHVMERIPDSAGICIADSATVLYAVHPLSEMSTNSESLHGLLLEIQQTLEAGQLDILSTTYVPSARNQPADALSRLSWTTPMKRRFTPNFRTAFKRWLSHMKLPTGYLDLGESFPDLSSPWFWNSVHAEAVLAFVPKQLACQLAQWVRKQNIQFCYVVTPGSGYAAMFQLFKASAYEQTFVPKSDHLIPQLMEEELVIHVVQRDALH